MLKENEKMHELSIALGIVDLAEKEAAKAGADEIFVIELEVGTVSGIMMDALDFAWPVATKGTLLENAERIIHFVKGKARCSQCGEVFEIETLYDPCPKCNGYFKDILQGKELRIKSLIVNE